MTISSSLPDASKSQYQELRSVKTQAIDAIGGAFEAVNPFRFDRTFEAVLPDVVKNIHAWQLALVLRADFAFTAALAEQGRYVDSDSNLVLNAPGFIGAVPSGGRVEYYVRNTVRSFHRDVAAGINPRIALERKTLALQSNVTNLLTDTLRDAVTANITVHDNVGWVRLVNTPACKDCVILSGKFFAWNTGFLRHPNCDCFHVPRMKLDQYISDESDLHPSKVFASMSVQEQNKGFTIAGAQAVRDGGNIFRVVNATSKGTKATNGRMTTAGLGKGVKRAWRGQRLSPQGIYERAAGDRNMAKQLLKEYGYVQDYEDSAFNSKSWAVGYGQLGRGGSRTGARQEIERALSAGKRSGSMATMTSAERRKAQASLRFKAMKENRNPYSAYRELTDQQRANIQHDYERYVHGLHGGDRALPANTIAGDGF